MSSDQALEETLKKAKGLYRRGLRDNANTLLLKHARQAQRPADFAVTAVSLMQKHNARYEALECLDILARRAPGDTALQLRRVSLQIQLGLLEAAAAALDALAGRAEPGVLAEYRARLAAARRDPDAGLALIGQARADGTDSAVLRELEIRALFAQGEHARALDCIEDAIAAFPDHDPLHVMYLHVHMAVHGAAATVAPAEELARHRPAALWIQATLAEILEAAGEIARSRQCLREAAESFPASHLPPLRLARFELREGNHAAALDWARRAQDLGRGLPAVGATYGRCLLKAGQNAEAAAQFEAMLARGQGSAELLRDLIQAHTQLGDMEAVRRHVRAGLNRYPGDPALMTQLVRAAASSERRPPDAAIAAWAAASLSEAQQRALKVNLHENAFEYAEALAALRQTPTAERDGEYGRQVARLLVLLKRLRLAKRYFRLCLRRWPDHAGLLGLTFAVFASNGEERAGLALLRATTEAHPRTREALAGHLTNFLADLNDCDAALACFRTVQSNGDRRLLPPSVRLLQALLAAGRAEEAAALIEVCRGTGIWDDPHFQKTAFGQIAGEARVTLAQPGRGAMQPLDLADAPGHAALMLAHPHSTIAGMRMLRHWQAHGPQPVAGTAAKESPEDPPVIPRTIWQYWNAPTPPEGIAAMIETWRGAEGFEHRLFDRRGALELLRNDFGPKWTRAFLLANNPAEESDFLRLCLLAARGGVYADADDILTGPLQRLVDRGPGLMVLVEPGKRILGNNFIAAAPRHPAILRAARNARHALLARANETTWSKTGPALLTRAVATYLARRMTAGEPADLGFLHMADLVGTLAIHNSAPHKRDARDWRGSRAVSRNDVFAEVLSDILREEGLLDAGLAA